MAKAIQPSTYQNGYYEPIADQNRMFSGTKPQNEGHYEIPPSAEVLTSVAHNDLGLNVQRLWPTLDDGTNSPHPLPKWWKPLSKVDVLICGGTSDAALVIAACADCLQPDLLGYK